MSGKSKAKGEGRKAKGHFPSAAPNLRYALGFTLIEVLIAMTLLSIMVVLLFSSLRICAKSWEQGESKIAEVNEVAVVYNFFQRHLSSAIPVLNDFVDQDGANAASQTGTGAETEKTLSFQGKKQSLQFVSVFPASAGRTGMQLFSIEAQEQEGEQVINVTLTPFFPVTGGEEWHKEEVVLLKHVSDFSLAYFGAADDAGESSWQDEWLDKDVQPRLVKISISTANDVFWPKMIIALKVAGAGGSALLGTGSAAGNEPAEDRD
ncbi:prepilin-type N-terminal cleavage/methylation domain-containing protein [Methylobacter tundripaludum]